MITGIGIEDLFINKLNDDEFKTYQQYLLEVQRQEPKWDEDQIAKKAEELMIRNIRILKEKKDTDHFKTHGWVKIFSSLLQQEVYLVMNMGETRKLPDQSLPVFTPEDIEALKGLDQAEMTAIMEAKVLFGGPIRTDET